MNPYLVYAAVLASGLDGIERKLEPPPEFRGDVYSATDQPHVATTLADALPAFAGSTFARDALGDTVVDHYAHFFQTELDAWHAAVTDWERQRYFERI